MKLICKNILFVPQNQTHIENLYPIANELNKLGCDVKFLSLESYVGQEIFNTVGCDFEIIKFDENKSNNTFYRASFLGKINLVFDFLKGIKTNDLDSPDFIVVCNDGAFQRAVFSKFPGSYRVLVLDGVITDYAISITDVLKSRKFQTLAEYVKKRFDLYWSQIHRRIPHSVGCFLPSVIATTKVDQIFVVSKYVEKFLREERFIKTALFSLGLPRYSEFTYFKDKYEKRDLVAGEPKIVLFISQGFAWHNEYENDLLQHEELRLLLSMLEGNDEYRVVIRLHPRDLRGGYLSYNVEIEQDKVPVFESLSKAEMVVGLTSTMLLEAAFLGAKVGFLRQSFLSSRLSNTFFESPDFPKIKNRKDFFSLFSPKGVCEYTNLSYYFNPNEVNTVQNIVREMLSLSDEAI